MTIGYFCVFYLSTVYDPNDFDVVILLYRAVLIFSTQSVFSHVYSPFQFLSSTYSDIDILTMVN